MDKLREKLKQFLPAGRISRRFNPSIEAWDWNSWAVYRTQKDRRRATLIYMPYRTFSSGPYSSKRFVKGNTKNIVMCPPHYEEFVTITTAMSNQWGWEYLTWVE